MDRDGEAGLGCGEGEIAEPGAGAAFEARAVAAEARALRRKRGLCGGWDAMSVMVEKRMKVEG